MIGKSVYQGLPGIFPCMEVRFHVSNLQIEILKLLFSGTVSQIVSFILAEKTMKVDVKVSSPVR